ncbi:MAG: glycosyltransferase [Armatimonadia bacterium]
MSDAVPVHVSIVIPVYNEEANLEELLRRLVGAAQTMGKPTELIFVDDGSSDGTLAALKAFSSPVVDVRVVELARNFGQHAAVMAGFTQCRGDIVVTIDADLQNPPEEIPRLVAEMERGYDVVGSVRQDRQDPLLRKISSKIVNRLVAKATGHDLHDYGCMLRAYNHDTVRAMLDCPERRTFIPALAMTVARTASEIEVGHADRFEGKSKYNIFSLLRLNLDLMMGFTPIPLRLVSVTGMIIAAVGLLFSLFLVIRRFVVGPEVEGVFTLFAGLYFFVGVQIMAVGLIGEYMARTYDEVRGRPRFIIRHVHARDGEAA